MDVDGVINTNKHRFTKFDEQCLEYLQQIIDVTGAKIVVSSSWRDEDPTRMKANFLENGFPEKLWDEIIDITDRGHRHIIRGSQFPICRGNEIKHWVDTKLKYPWHSDKSLQKQYELLNDDGSFKIMNTNILNIDYSYVILDDDSDMLYEQKDNFIHTDALLGLSQNDVVKAIKILNYV